MKNNHLISQFQENDETKGQRCSMTFNENYRHDSVTTNYRFTI